MVTMKKIRKLIFGIKHFVNYLYYFKSSITKNSYLCKLVGEKINPLGGGTIVTYKILGLQGNNEIALQELLSNKTLIERFHPAEAAKLGSIAFEDVTSEVSENQKKEVFCQIKNIMLNSIHDTCPNKKFEDSTPEYNRIEPKRTNNLFEHLSSVIIENKYQCKLVAGKSSPSGDDTIITFTMLGKREGYEKLLQKLLSDKKLLEKFHPTEAIKFGFIARGDFTFGLPEMEKIEKMCRIKNKAHIL